MVNHLKYGDIIKLPSPKMVFKSCFSVKPMRIGFLIRCACKDSSSCSPDYSRLNN